MRIIDVHNHYYPPAYLDALEGGPSAVRVTRDDEGNPVLHYPGDYNVAVRGHRDLDYREQVLESVSHLAAAESPVRVRQVPRLAERRERSRSETRWCAWTADGSACSRSRLRIDKHHPLPAIRNLWSWRGVGQATHICERVSAMIRSPAAWLFLVSCLGCAPPPDGAPDEVPPLAATVDTMVDVGTHRLHLRVRRGDVPVTVLFEAGGAAALDSWADVPDSLAARSRASVVSYDRAGLGMSELGGLDITPRAEVENVRRALQMLRLPDRTIVVGHSYGAMMALLHADAFPENVSGLVLVDPMNPRFVAEVGDWLKTTAPSITDPGTDREFAVRRMVEGMDSLSAELLISEPALDQPMWLVSAGEPWWGPEEIDAAWEASHRSLVAASSRRIRTVAEGVGHDIPAEAPAAILSAIDEALAAVGDGGT